MGGMKYVVFKDTLVGHEYMIIFPSTMTHADMAKKFEGKPVAGGFLYDYTINEYDQVRLSGEAMSLGVKSRPEDLELFHRLADGM